MTVRAATASSSLRWLWMLIRRLRHGLDLFRLHRQYGNAIAVVG